MSQQFGSAFVPHDLAAPIAGAAQGPLAGLTGAVKDMYDIAGTRTGGGSPDWLDAHPAQAHVPEVEETPVVVTPAPVDARRRRKRAGAS